MPTIVGDSPYVQRISVEKLACWMAEQGISERRIARFQLCLRKTRFHPYGLPMNVQGLYNVFLDRITLATDGLGETDQDVQEAIHQCLMHEFQHMKDRGNAPVQVANLLILVGLVFALLWLPVQVIGLLVPFQTALLKVVWIILLTPVFQKIYYKLNLLEQRANKAFETWHGQPNFF